MQIKITKKKFYNKWNYKINFFILGANYFRIFDGRLDNHDYSSYFRTKADFATIKKLVDELLNFEKTEYQTRVEHNWFDVYTNNEKIYNVLVENFKEFICYTSIPKDEEVLSEHGFIPISTKKLPHNQYSFKAFLKPHVLKNNVEAKENYLNFLNLQKPRIKISKSVESWFMETNYNWDPRYIYVEDKNTLLMLKMKNTPVLGRIYEYVLDDK